MVCITIVMIKCFIIQVPASAQTPTSQTATRGRDGLLNCQASGDPEPSINWFRNETLLVNTTKYIILQNGSLWIRDVEDSDAGNYTCQAINIAGVQLAITNLIIFGEIFGFCMCAS